MCILKDRPLSARDAIVPKKVNADKDIVFSVANQGTSSGIILKPIEEDDWVKGNMCK